MKKISYILLFAAFSAQAQKLSTEITVERTVVPAERAAMRLNSVSPSIVPATYFFLQHSPLRRRNSALK